MSKSFHLFRHGLWLAIFLFSLLGSTQNAQAQFGLFDTVWTRNNQSVQILSENESLFFLYNRQDTTSYLVNTLDLAQVKWSVTSKYPTTNVPLKFLENDSKILFLTWDKISNKTHYKFRDANNFNVIDSVEYNYQNFPYSGCSIYRMGISEVDSSIYFGGYCNVLDIKASTYKVNYRTGQVKETSHILPYFAMTISEDGQYVAGVYYTGGTASNVPYNEVLEVRKISDYSLVFRKESKYCDWKPSITPYQWVTNYKFKFSKDNKYLLHYILGTFDVYNLDNKMQIFTQKPDTILIGRRIISFTKNSKDLLYLYYTSKSGAINNVEYILLNMENLKQKTFKFSLESEVFEGGDGGLLFNDQFILSETTRIYDKNYQNRKRYDMSLARLNFDVNSIQEPENQIHGTLYPNPTNMNLTLKLQLESPKTLSTSLFNTEGSLIKEFGINQYEQGENTLLFDVSELLSGIYFLKLSGERFSQTYKVIINR